MEGSSFCFCIALSVIWTATVCLEHDFQEDVFEVAVDTVTDNVFVGGDSIVYKLDKDLKVLQSTTFGDCAGASSGCSNRVTVLEVDYTFQRLLVCGSASEGQCWFLDPRDLTVKRLNSGEGSRIHAGRLQGPIVKQTAGESTQNPDVSNWIVSSPNTETKSFSTSPSKPILSVRQIRTVTGSDFNMQYPYGVDRNVIRKHNSSFYFDFVDGFCVDDECFYLTLQQANASSEILTSRIANVCARAIFPYVEMPFDEAAHEAVPPKSEKVYNRALAVSLGKLGRVRQSRESRGVVDYVLVSVFGRATDRTSREADPKEGFAVSAMWLGEKVQKRISAERFICALRPSNDHAPKSPDWYTGAYTRCKKGDGGQLLKHRCSNHSTLNPVIQTSESDRVICQANVTVKDGDDIGNVLSVFTHTYPQEEMDSTGQKQLADSMTIYVTTSAGRIYKFHAQVGSFNKLTVTPLPQKLMTGEEPLTALRKDVVVTDQHYYLLSGSRVIRRSLDYCSAVDNCFECIKGNTGCGWCASSRTCQLGSKCGIREKCPQPIHMISPGSVPVSGGTILTIHGGGLESPIHSTAVTRTVTICGQDCPIVTAHNNTESGLKCAVPASANLTARNCNVTVTVSGFSSQNSATVPNFTYTIPTVKSFSPSKMLFSEAGDIVFKGDHLDTGSKATVVFRAGNSSVVCHVKEERSKNSLTCRVTDVTNVTSLTSPEACGKDQTVGQERCYKYDVTLTIDGFRVDHLGSFCRCSNPTVSTIHPGWAFHDGSVALTVTGTNLNLPDVQLGLNVNTNKSHTQSCEVCPGITDGTCIVCCSPDVTNLTTSSGADEMTAQVWFDMRSKQRKDDVEYYSEPIRINLLRAPAFTFVDHANAPACLRVTPDSPLKIKGTSLPLTLSSPYLVTVGGHVCREGFFHQQTSATVICSPQSTRKPLLRNRTADNVDHGAGGCTAVLDEEGGDFSDESLGPDTEFVRVILGGRAFLVGCISFAEKRDLSSNVNIIHLIASAAGGGLFLLLVVIFAVCFVRRKKMQFQKRFLAQHSLSGGVLIPSESGGSAEYGYVSVERLLNPTGDPEKLKEIQDSGLLIHRKHLNLGSVIGQGNFGCVFEGYYQRDETDEDAWELVAVKTLIDRVTHAIDMKAFIDEAMLMKDFSHDHVLGLLGLSEGERGPLVVMPYMERGDLLTYVKDETTVLTVGDVLKFSRDIANGMDYLASNKFVHRDLAARNCMLDKELRVKVADFGLCRDVYEKGYYRSDNKKKLPIRWMAMESIETGSYTSKSDVWSLGVVIWEMTTRGITPYPGVDGWDILHYLSAGRRMDQPFLCPDALYALMERCWKAQPLERPTFNEVEHDLNALIDSLQEPAAANALCVSTLISFPSCHRFKDDAAVVEKVKAAMRKMSQGAATLMAASPELSPVSHNTSTSSAFVSSPESDNQAAVTASGFRFPSGYSGAVAGRSVNWSAEADVSEAVRPAADAAAAKDDGYFLLEQDPHALSDFSQPPTPQRQQRGGNGAVSVRSDPTVSWCGQREMRDLTSRDDGYFELEIAEESSRL